jgi:hypothetical protein
MRRRRCSLISLPLFLCIDIVMNTYDDIDMVLPFHACMHYSVLAFLQVNYSSTLLLLGGDELINPTLSRRVHAVLCAKSCVV